jgi:hypothetical protein
MDSKTLALWLGSIEDGANNPTLGCGLYFLPVYTVGAAWANDPNLDGPEIMIFIRPLKNYDGLRAPMKGVTDITVSQKNS